MSAHEDRSCYAVEIVGGPILTLAGEIGY